MSSEREQRTHACGEPVVAYWISDAHDSGTVQQFVYQKDGSWYTGDFCPRCHGELTVDNTQTVQHQDRVPTE